MFFLFRPICFVRYTAWSAPSVSSFLPNFEGALTSGMSWAFSMRTILTVSPPHCVRVSPWVGGGSGCISVSAMLSWARSRDCKARKACLQEKFKHTSRKRLMCCETEGAYLGHFNWPVRCRRVPVSTWMCVSDSRLWSSSPSLFWLCWMRVLTWNHQHVISKNAGNVF